MDLLCDTLLLEEVLPHLEPKPLLRLFATSRRYNALVLNPGFAALYWPRAGVFLQPAAGEHPQGALPSSAAPRFLAAAASARQGRHGLDLAKDGVAAIVHSAAGGLLLCSRRLPTRRSACYYVCNPVTQHWRVLPELPGRRLCYKPQCGLLTVAGDGARFRVVVIEEWQMEDLFLELHIFSSDTGRWMARHLSLPGYPFEHDLARRPVLGPSGAAYWIQRDDYECVAIAYDSATNALRVIQLPGSFGGGGGSDSCSIGERGGGGGGLRFARADAAALEVWDSETKEGGAWALAHRVGIAELLGESSASDAARRYVKPVAFHPTDVDVVFLALPSGVATYSMKHGTMDMQCTHNCFAAPADVFPYVHPPYPVQIPAIHNLTLARQRKRKANDGTYSSKNGTSSLKR
ncbi:unnamed protein product [Urochloa humidicola]